MTAQDLISKHFTTPQIASFNAIINYLIKNGSESVRLELTAMLNPWRPIETAPKDDDAPLILGIREGAKIPGIIGWDDGWYWLNGMFKSPCKPTHWLPLPAPPSEEK